MKYVARDNDKGYCGVVNEMVFLKLFYSDGLLKPALTDEEAIGLTHFRPMFPFYTPWKHQKTKDFLVFSWV